MRRGVLEFIEEAKQFPQRITVEITGEDQYLFYLLVSFYKKRTGTFPVFYTRTKQTEKLIKAVVEERKLLKSAVLYVLEGFSDDEISRLVLPAGTYVVARTQNGELKAEKLYYGERRRILRALLGILGLKYSLRELLAIDWSGMGSFAEYEGVLRKAHVAGWTEQEIGERVRKVGRGGVLAALRKGQYKEIYEQVEDKGPEGFWSRLGGAISRIIRFRFLREMGYEVERAGEELGVNRRKAEELEREAAAFTKEELVTLVQEFVKADAGGNRETGVDLFLLGTQLRWSGGK